MLGCSPAQTWPTDGGVIALEPGITTDIQIGPANVLYVLLLSNGTLYQIVPEPGMSMHRWPEFASWNASCQE